MKIVVVGCGAMGGLFAATLAGAGAQVWAYDIWADHIAAIAAGGLALHHAGRDRVVAMQATTDPATPGVADVVLIFVKSGQTVAAAQAARPMVGRDTVLVTLQNGLGNVERIRGVYPTNPILFGFTPLTSEIQRPGAIEASGAGRSCMWPDGGAVLPAMKAFVALLTQGGIDAAMTPGIELEIWKKLVVNCCFNPVCALTGLTVGEAATHLESAPLIQGILAEIVSLAAARGIGLDAALARTYLDAVGAAAAHHYPSMVADFHARRPTEIDGLNGAVVRHCAEYEIAAPFNQAMVSLIRMAEAGWATV